MKKKQPTIMQTILRGMADQATPANFDLWERINSRPVTRRQNVMVGFATLSVGLLIMLALILTIKSQPIVAVLASPTATQAATEAPTMPAPIKSYRGVVFGQSRRAESPDNPPSYELWQAYIWYQAPDFLRIEEYRACPKTPVAAPGQTPALPPLKLELRAEFTGPTFTRCTEPEQIILHTDQRIITIATQDNKITASFSDSVNINAFWPALPVDLDAFLPSPQKSMSSMGHPLDFTGARYGPIMADTIIGRPAAKIDETYNVYSAGTPPEKSQIYRTLWIDQEVGIPIAAETIDNQGFIMDSWTFSLLEVNSSSDQSLFAYLPRPTTSVTIDGLATMWGQMAHNATFAVFIPGSATIASVETATKLMPQYPAYDTSRHVLTQTYLSRADPTKYAIALTITEQPAEGTPSPDYQYQEANGLRTLTLDRSETHIVIEGNDELTKQDLYDIADNLRPLS